MHIIISKLRKIVQFLQIVPSYHFCTCAANRRCNKESVKLRVAHLYLMTPCAVWCTVTAAANNYSFLIIIMLSIAADDTGCSNWCDADTICALVASVRYSLGVVFHHRVMLSDQNRITRARVIILARLRIIVIFVMSLETFILRFIIRLYLFYNLQGVGFCDSV